VHIVVGGASGFLGRSLVARLRDQGHRVTRLERSDSPGDDASSWDPAAGRIDQGLINDADAVVNLSGAAISRWPWSAAYRRELLDSRLGATSTIATAVAAATRPPALVSASGMSVYGADRGDELLDESAGPGAGFLADVCRRWEAAAAPAVEAGSRVSFVRTSMVMHRDGGTLRLMLPAWKAGLGATLSSGSQYFSIISRDDWVRGVEFLLTTPAVSGAFNFANPSPVTNAEFTKALASAVHRPSLLRAPRFAMRLVLGRLADELLGSLRLRPAALTAAGFAFEHPDLESTLAAALRKP